MRRSGVDTGSRVLMHGFRAQIPSQWVTIHINLQNKSKVTFWITKVTSYHLNNHPTPLPPFEGANQKAGTAQALGSIRGGVCGCPTA